MAKLGIALGSGPRGLGFESRYSDHRKASKSQGFGAFSNFFSRKCVFLLDYLPLLSALNISTNNAAMLFFQVINQSIIFDHNL